MWRSPSDAAPYYTGVGIHRLSAYRHHNQLPGRGILREIYQPLQPLAEFHKFLYQVHYHHTQQGHPLPPKVWTVQHVCPNRGASVRTPWHQNMKEGGETRATLSLHQCHLGVIHNNVTGTGPPSGELQHLQIPLLVLKFDGNSWPFMVGNLQKAQNKWGRFSHLMVQEGADDKTFEFFCDAGTIYLSLRGVNMGGNALHP